MLGLEVPMSPIISFIVVNRVESFEEGVLSLGGSMLILLVVPEWNIIQTF